MPLQIFGALAVVAFHASAEQHLAYLGGETLRCSFSEIAWICSFSSDVTRSPMNSGFRYSLCQQNVSLVDLHWERTRRNEKAAQASGGFILLREAKLVVPKSKNAGRKSKTLR